MTHRFLIVAIVLCGCKASESGSANNYRGTVVVGAGYVQVLATADGDRGCPPRIQEAGRCVRTPPSDGDDCEKQPPCIQTISVSADDKTMSRASGAYVEVPWLRGAAAGTSIRIAIAGCGGAAELDVKLGAALAPFEAPTARATNGALEFSWRTSSADEADQVCSLWRGGGVTEVCCGADSGAARVSTGESDGPSDARLSRGRHLGDVGTLRIYQTRETGNLLP